MAIVSVIQSEVGNNVLVWKHPEQDFNTKSQLIVHQSQEALLFRNGQALDLFAAGRHTLDTENVPLLRKLIGLVTGGETPFHCEVYFFNKTDSMDVQWGTRDRVPITDPVYDIILSIGANGQFAVRVEDPRKLIVKLVGTVPVFDQNSLTTYFRGILMSKIRDYLSNMVTKHQIPILELNSHLNEMSEDISAQLGSHFEEYGIKLVNFFVNTIVIPEDDPSYIELKNAKSAAAKRRIDAKAKRDELDTLDYTYREEKAIGVLETAAQNEGIAGTIMGAGMGLGMGAGVGSFIGGAMGGAVANMQNQQQAAQTAPAKKCTNCNADIPANGKFCLECGTKVIEEGQILCPHCGESTASGKFCLHCGGKLQLSCANCGAALPAGAKFCLECGTKA